MENRDNNFVNPSYNEGSPHTSGNIVASYTIEEKDTLPEVARKFGLSVDELLQANADNIKNAGEMIQTGTRIMIPKASGGA